MRCWTSRGDLLARLSLGRPCAKLTGTDLSNCWKSLADAPTAGPLRDFIVLSVQSSEIVFDDELNQRLCYKVCKMYLPC